MSVQEQKQALYDFVVNNPKLEELEAKINAFNPFNVLRISHHEIRHSNVLAWLLDPRGNHGLSDYFLKKFLCNVILVNEDKFSDAINIADLSLKDFTSSTVTREEKNIDIQVKSPNNKLILIIENKIESDESEYQLTKYYNEIKASHYDWFKIPVYLTLEGKEAKYHDKFGSFSHGQVLQIIEETLSLKDQYLQPSIKEFILYYFLSLKTTIGMNPEIAKMCKEIYTNHQLAADTLFQYIQSHKNEELENGIRLFLAQNNITCYQKNDKETYFLPTELAEKIRDEGGNNKFSKPIALYIKEEKNTLSICLEVSKFDSNEDRSEFIEFCNVGLNLKKKTTGKTTKLFSESELISSFEAEVINQKLNDVYFRLQPKLQQFEKVVSKYFDSK